MLREDVQSSNRISPPRSRTSPSSLSPASNDSPLLALSNSHIEAIIQMATASAPEGPIPGRDTRTQLFVGNLPYRVRWQDLKDLFRKAGTILRADVSLGPDNRSRGYGTVLFATREDAARAVEMFSGYNWQTRILEVRLDRLPPSELDISTHSSHLNSSAGSSSFSSYGVPSSSDRIPFTSNLDDFPFSDSRSRTLSNGMTRNLFVGNLPFHCQWQDLKDLFRQAGTIIRADVALGPDGRSRGFGTVSFANDTDAERAVNIFNGYDYNGRILKVHYDKFAQAQTLLSQTQSPLLRLASPNPAQPQSLSSRFDSGTVAANMGSHTLIPVPAPLSALERELSLSRHRTPSPFHRPVNTASLYRDVYPVSDSLDNDATGIQSAALTAPLSSTTHALSMSLNETLQFTSSHQPFRELDPSASPDQAVGSFTHSHLPLSAALPPSSLSLPSAENGPSSSVLAARKSGPPPVPLSTKPSLSAATTNSNSLGCKNEETLMPNLNASLTSSSPLPALGSSTSASPKKTPTTSAKAAPPPISSEPANVSTSTPANVSTSTPAPVLARITTSETLQRIKTLSRSRQNSSHPHPHPGPITLPSPSLPSFPPAPGGIPASPFQGLPPITPSMPTFTFVPQNATPPLNPHFLSPGVGLTPFSPPAPMSPGSYYHPNHRYHPIPWNPAPGAPIHHPHPHSPIYAVHGHSPLHSPSAASYFAGQSAVISGPAGPPADYFSVPPPMAPDGYFPPVYSSAETANSNDLEPGSNTDSATNGRPGDRPSSSDDSIPTRSGHSMSEDGGSRRLSRDSSDASSWHNSSENLHFMAEELGRISIGARDSNKPPVGNTEVRQWAEQGSMPPSGPQRTHSDETKLPTTSSLGTASRSEASIDSNPDPGTENVTSSLLVHTPGERRASWTPGATKTVFRRELMNSTPGSTS